MCELYRILFRREEGQGLVEYGLLIALVILVVIGALHALGIEVGYLFEHIGEKTSEVL